MLLGGKQGMLFLKSVTTHVVYGANCVLLMDWELQTYKNIISNSASWKSRKSSENEAEASRSYKLEINSAYT